MFDQCSALSRQRKGLLTLRQVAVVRRSDLVRLQPAAVTNSDLLIRSLVASRFNHGVLACRHDIPAPSNHSTSSSCLSNLANIRFTERALGRKPAESLAERHAAHIRFSSIASRCTLIFGAIRLPAAPEQRS